MRLFHHSMLVAVMFATSAPVRAADVDRAGETGPDARPATSANPSPVAPLISISGGSVTEGGKLEYVVALSAASDSEVTVSYTVETKQSTAAVNRDYTYLPGSITFEPGDRKKTIQVQTYDDRESEFEEYVTVSLSEPTGAGFWVGRNANSYRFCAGDWGTCVPEACCVCGWILDNEPPAVSVSDASGLESAGSLSFRLNLNKGPGSAASVKFSTKDGTAKSGEDYTAASKTVEFGAGETSKTVVVPIALDDNAEGNETFTVHLSEAMGLIIYDGEGTGTIMDDDPPAVRVSDASGLESAGSLSFRLDLSRSHVSAVSVKFSTKDGTAKSGEDYTATSETVEFAAGETSKTVAVPLVSDDEAEPDKTFTVHLSEAAGLAVLDGEGTGTIVDDDALPTVSILDARARESAGKLEFALALNKSVQGAVSVDFSTSDGTAVAGEDYTGTTETVEFGAGQTRRTVAVPVADDDIVEMDETLKASLSNPTGATILDGEATGTIESDDLPLLTVRGSSAPEGEMLEYALTLDAPISQSVSVSCRSRYNPFPALQNPRAYRLARAGEDYVEHNGEVIVFAPGETRKTFGVRTLDDQTDEPEEAVIGDCWNAKNAVFATLPGSAACPWRTCGARGCADCSTITDNDPDAEISLSDISVSESAGVATVSGKLSVRSERLILVNWGTRSGTAEVGKDFERRGSHKSFSPWWNDGLHGVSFQVPIIDDDLVEPDETFTVWVTGRDGVSIADGEATVTIVDNDEAPKAIVLAASPKRVSEGGGATEIEVTATLDGGTRSEATEVTVSVSGGGDPGAVDFAAVEDFAITIAAGESGGTGSFTLTPEDDNVDETDETLAVDGSSDLDVTGDAVVLEDDDEGPSRIVLSAEPRTVSEGAGETFVEVTARLDGAARTTATEVTVSASGGGDPGAVDFAPVPDFEIVIGAGATVAGATFALTPVDDDVEETDETLSLSGESDLPVTPTSVTITDDDVAAREILLSASPPLVSEGAGPTPVTVTASLSGAARQVGTTVTVSVSGSGDAGAVDFAAVPDFEIVIPANAPSGAGAFTLAPEDDAAAEADERLGIAGRSDLPVRPTSVRLADDDKASTRILLSARPSRVSEGDGPTPVEVTARLDGSARTAATNVTVSVSGSGDPGAVDFAPVPDFEIVIPANAPSGTGAFTLAPEDDAVAEADERLGIAGRSDLPVTSTSVTLADDDEDNDNDDEDNDNDDEPRRILLSASPERVSEGDGPTRVEVTAALDGARRQEATTVAVSVSGSGDPGAADFAPVPDFGIVIAAGEPSGTATFALVPEDDLVVEADETLTVSGASDLPVAPATVELLDDDEAPARWLSIADAGAAEGAGEMEFAVTLDGPAASGVAVDYATADPAGSMGPAAEAGVDYKPATGTLEFAPGEVSKTIRVPVIDDALDEPDEEFAVALSAPRGAALGRGSAFGTIRDDDETPTLSVADASGVEDAGALEFAATLSAPSLVEVTVDYATADPAGPMGAVAAAGVDYKPATGTLEFAPGEVSKTIRVAILDDALDEPDEEFAVALSGPRGAALDRGSASGTIRDDDETPSLSVADASGGEDAGELEFAVALSAPSGIGVSASYATSDGTAQAGVDYEAASGALEFAPGEVSKTIRVAVIDDDLHEADEETFGVSLSALANASAADVSATGTILDDDLAPPALSGRLPAALLCVGGALYELDLAEYFAGEELRFSAVSAAPEVASATLDGSRLSIVPGIEGETSVAVSAANGSGSAGGAVEVRVAADPAELEALESALASIGRGILAGVSESVRARFDPAALPGGGRDDPPAAGVARNPPMPGVGLPGRDRGGWFGAEAVANGWPGADGGLAAAGLPRRRGMEPFSFSLDSAGADGPAWSVWGRGEAQRFGSAPGSSWHDGALESAHVGAEWRTGAWLAGVSASRSAASADYRFERSVEACGGGSGSGEIEADVSGVHPYAGRRVGAGWVWATLGRGGGEFRMRRCEGGEWSASDLSMRLAAAGGRHPFARRESTELSVVEEVGVVELETGGDAGLLARAGRAKLGLEASGVAEPGCECPLTTFVRAFALGDWGDGATGAGLEVSAGVRFRHIPLRFGVDAGVRALAAAEDARERSANVALSLLPRADGTGWRGSLAWRRGSAAPVLGVAGGIAPWAAPGGVPQAARRDWTSRSRLGYGIAGARGVATPFVELDAARSGRGARVGARHEFGGPAGRLVVEWGVERGGLPGGGRILLEAVGRF